MPPMASDRPLPVESLLPFKQKRSSETRSILQDAQAVDPNPSRQSPESQDEDEASGNERPKLQKRSRACVACRNMKIRCLPVDGQEACRSCAKVNRQCIMPGPPRKRQKTVHKVAELEKKINALTDALLARGQHTENTSTEASPTKDAPTNSSSVPAGTEETRTDESTHNDMDHYQRSIVERAAGGAYATEISKDCGSYVLEPAAKDSYIDVIERGELTIESATAMFNYWMEEMCPSCPIVVFPPGTGPQEIRTKRPITFLTILAITSPKIEPSAQPSLTVELNRQICERVLFHGDKSLDLVQAMLLNCSYYIRPRSARDLAFNQNISSAIVMGLEIGIGKRSKLKPSSPIEELELCRTWLACYQASTSVSAMLRTPSYVKFDPRIEECLEKLETSPHALPTDHWLCDLVRLAHLAEEVAVAFNLDDPGADLNFHEPRIQYQLKCFQRQLRDWERSVDVSVDPRLVQHNAACLNLYMHEIAIHCDHNVDDFGPGTSSNGLRKAPDFISPSHIDALSTLLESSHRVLNNYLALDTDFARSLCTMYIVWNTYAVVVLIKLHWIVNAPDSELGSVFVSNIKAEYYLDAILTKLTEISANGRSPCAEAFGFVYKKLKIWHCHRAAQLTDDSQGEECRRERASSVLRQDPLQIIASAKAIDYSGSLPGNSSPAILPGGQWTNAPDRLMASNLNAAYDAASYGNTNWDEFNFSSEEMNVFDVYMNNTGWMGYLL